MKNSLYIFIFITFGSLHLISQTTSNNIGGFVFGPKVGATIGMQNWNGGERKSYDQLSWRSVNRKFR